MPFHQKWSDFHSVRKYKLSQVAFINFQHQLCLWSSKWQYIKNLRFYHGSLSLSTKAGYVGMSVNLCFALSSGGELRTGELSLIWAEVKPENWDWLLFLLIEVSRGIVWPDSRIEISYHLYTMLFSLYIGSQVPWTNTSITIVADKVVSSFSCLLLWCCLLVAILDCCQKGSASSTTYKLPHNLAERSGEECGVPTQFLDKRIKFIFGGDKWIKLKYWG